MRNIRRIVVGVDGSDTSRAALRWAYDEAGGHGTSLTVVTAWHSPPYPKSPRSARCRRRATLTSQSTIPGLARWADRRPRGHDAAVHVRTVVEEGNPVQVLIEQSARPICWWSDRAATEALPACCSVRSATTSSRTRSARSSSSVDHGRAAPDGNRATTQLAAGRRPRRKRRHRFDGGTGRRRGGRDHYSRAHHDRGNSGLGGGRCPWPSGSTSRSAANVIPSAPCWPQSASNWRNPPPTNSTSSPQSTSPRGRASRRRTAGGRAHGSRRLRCARRRGTRHRPRRSDQSVAGRRLVRRGLHRRIHIAHLGHSVAAGADSCGRNLRRRAARARDNRRGECPPGPSSGRARHGSTGLGGAAAMAVTYGIGTWSAPRSLRSEPSRLRMWDHRGAM